MSSVHFRRLERRGAQRVGGRLELSLTLPKTASGMEMRLCPQSSCAPRLFQLGDVRPEEEWSDDEGRVRRGPHSDGTTCPYCGHDSDDQAFVDPRDIEALTEWFKWAAQEDALDAASDMFKNVGRRLPRGGPISFKANSSRRTRPEPRIWREDLLRHLTCSVCFRTYGVYAIALFCPDCGAPNIAVHFQRECELVEQQIELARQAEDPELSFRLLGNAHEDVVTALETYLKTVYRYLVAKRFPEADAARLTSARSVGNALQNIGRAREKFGKLQIDPFETLDEDDFQYLRLNIEKRHVLGHNLGLIDEKYAEIATAAQPGETVVLLADEVSRFALLGKRVVEALELKAFPSGER